MDQTGTECDENYFMWDDCMSTDTWLEGDGTAGYSKEDREIYEDTLIREHLQWTKEKQSDGGYVGLLGLLGRVSSQVDSGPGLYRQYMGDKAWEILTGPLVDCPLYINDPVFQVRAAAIFRLKIGE